jgi:hypothetical protein
VDKVTLEYIHSDPKWTTIPPYFKLSVIMKQADTSDLFFAVLTDASSASPLMIFPRKNFSHLLTTRVRDK